MGNIIYIKDRQRSRGAPEKRQGIKYRDFMARINAGKADLQNAERKNKNTEPSVVDPF